MPKSDWSVEQKRQLVEALLKCPILNTRQGRDEVVGQLSAQVRKGIQRRDDAKSDVTKILNHSISFKSGLSDLFEAIKFFEGDSLPFQNFELVLKQLTQANLRLANDLSDQGCRANSPAMQEIALEMSENLDYYGEDEEEIDMFSKQKPTNKNRIRLSESARKELRKIQPIKKHLDDYYETIQNQINKRKLDDAVRYEANSICAEALQEKSVDMAERLLNMAGDIIAKRVADSPKTVYNINGDYAGRDISNTYDVGGITGVSGGQVNLGSYGTDQDNRWDSNQ